MQLEFVPVISCEGMLDTGPGLRGNSKRCSKSEGCEKNACCTQGHPRKCKPSGGQHRDSHAKAFKQCSQKWAPSAAKSSEKPCQPGMWHRSGEEKAESTKKLSMICLGFTVHSSER